MIDSIIVGAGFAGAVTAERLASAGLKVLVIEKHNHVAGHCFDYRSDNGIIIHKYGPHLFHTNNTGVWEYLSKFTEWDVYQHKVKAFIDGQYIPIPFNLDSIRMVFPSSVADRIEQKLLKYYKLNEKVPILELKKNDDKDINMLADYVYEKIFLNYTAKQWGMRPEEIDSSVTARVPVFIGRDDRYFNDRYQGVPTRGYTKMFENILDHPNIKLMLNTDFKEVCELKDGEIYFIGKKFDGKVVYTGMVDELFDFKFGELPYRSLKMQFSDINQESYQSAATVNYPNNYEFTRITEFKKIHRLKSEITTILKEMPDEYRRGENTPYYPVFTGENQRIYEQYAEYAKTYSNLSLLGRLAEYRYYDMDDIVMESLSKTNEC